jgi:sigma-B regulation protein RsbU (phosphoserine phosphatase)
MSAALVTAIIKTAFQGWVESREGLEGFAHRLNRRLCRDTPVDSFAAVFIAVYDVETRELTYTNCGHNPEPWILPADGADLVRLDDARGMIMGVDEEIFPVKVRGRRLQPGQCVVFTTDGVIEETSPEGDLFGRERLEQVLAELSGVEVRQITRRIAETAGAFAGETAQNDDCTILAMRVRP